MRLACLARGLVMAAALLAGPASAAVYTGVWDPPVDDGYPNLGWRGTADFFVPDACVPTGTVDVLNSTACGGLAAVSQATVVFYALDDVDALPRLTLTIDAASMQVQTLRFIDGQLEHLSTSLSSALRVGDALIGFDVPPLTDFQLQFTLADGPRLAFTDPNCLRNPGEECSPTFNDGTRYPPQFRISSSTRVPEPATGALVAVAALGLALASRRRVRA